MSDERISARAEGQAIEEFGKTVDKFFRALAPDAKKIGLEVIPPSSTPAIFEAIYPPPCIHGDGQHLCERCQEELDEDPSAYWEFGKHPRGLANCRAQDEEMEAMAVEANAALAERRAIPDSDIPF